MTTLESWHPSIKFSKISILNFEEIIRFYIMNLNEGRVLDCYDEKNCNKYLN